jgi:phage tail sheath protein FI
VSEDWLVSTLVQIQSSQNKKRLLNIKVETSGQKPIEGLSTSIVGFLGETEKGSTTPTLIRSWAEYQKVFGGFFGVGKFLPFAVQGFFLNGGKKCYVSSVISETGSGQVGLSDYVGNSGQKTGLAGFETVDEISIVYIPNSQLVFGLTDVLIDHCERLKDRFAIIDSLQGQTPSNIAKPRSTSYAALYYPWIEVADPTTLLTRLVPPGGHIAGIYVRTDIEKGVHKAPANEVVNGAISLEYVVSKSGQVILNLQGINCVRAFEGRGIMVWGARTLSYDPEWKYINVRRLIMYLTESIQKGTQWVVFEPNNEITWLKIVQSITNFLTQTWYDKALMGTKPNEAFFVKCDRTTMTQNDIDNGQFIAQVGVAPLKPAEFMIFSIMQSAGSATPKS